MFRLDGTDPAVWDARVREPALAVARQLVDVGGALAPGTTPSEEAVRVDVVVGAKEEWAAQTCDVCGVTRHTPSEWEAHLKSKQHRKRKRRRRNLVQDS